MTITIADVKIDPELEAYLPVLGAESDSALEAALIAAGGADESIKVWAETGFIIDGHRRFRLCKANHLKMRFETISFKDNHDVFLWILRRQLSRRNLSDIQRAHFDAELVRLNEDMNNFNRTEAIQAVADETAKSIHAVRRSVDFNESIEALPEKVQAKIQSGEVKASRRSLIAFENLEDKQKKQVISRIVKGEASSVSEAIHLVARAPVQTELSVPGKAKKKVAKADVAMPESFTDDAGNPVPDELFDVWRERGRFYQIANDLQRLGGEIVELGEAVSCEKTANLASELSKIRESLLGRQPSVVKGRIWLSKEACAK